MSKSTPQRKFLIPETDYRRIFLTTRSILDKELVLDHARACLFYNIIGAEILRKHYGIDARAVVGMATFYVNPTTPNVLSFATMAQGQLIASESGFHCWVEAEGWMIDFSAPMFREALAQGGNPNGERRMFQKPLSEMQSSVGALTALGQFHCQVDEELSFRMIGNFYAMRPYLDLLAIAVDWYRKPPKRMLPKLWIGDGKGNVKEVPLLQADLTGSW